MSEKTDPNVPDGETPTAMAELISPTDQIGRNVMAALEDADSVAVLTTLVPGISSDRIVSVGLTRDQMHQVGILLNEIEAEDEEAAQDERRCIGFQCRVDKA
jgi:hypothetical protein